MKRKSPYNSPNQKSPRGVNFFQQFSRQFLRPYGEADLAPSVETVLRRIQPFTCEWLLRPKVALSELSETVFKNTNVITDESDGIFTEDFKLFLKDQFKPFEKCLKNLHKDSDICATEDDVIETLKLLYQENDTLDSIIDQLFQLGGAMFVIAIQYIVARTLIRCPEEYGEQVQAEDGTDSIFQSQRDIKSMRDFIVKSVIGKSKSTPIISPRRSLIAEFDQPSPNKPSNFPTSKKRSVDEFQLHDDSQPSTSSGRRSSSTLVTNKFQARKISSGSDSSSEGEETFPPQPVVPQKKVQLDAQDDRSKAVVTIKQERKTPKEGSSTQKTNKAKNNQTPLQSLAEDEPVEAVSEKALAQKQVPTPLKKNKKSKKFKK